MLTSAKNFKNTTIFDNSGTRNQKEDMKTRQITPLFFICFASPNCLGKSILHLKVVKIYFHGASLDPFWSAKYLNFDGERCENTIFPISIQETYTLRKVKTRFYFFYQVKNKFQNFQGNLVVYSSFIDNISGTDRADMNDK